MPAERAGTWDGRSGNRGNEGELRRWLATVEGMTAADLLAAAQERWGPRVALVTAFQAEGMVLLDLASRHAPGLRVLTIDTGRLPAESYDLMESIRDRYGVEVELLFPEHDRVEKLVRLGGPNLFYRSVDNRERCCEVRKVDPLRRALRHLDGWVTGLRREQAASRAGVARAELEEGGRVKLNPLADWSWAEVWRYLRDRRVPYHPLYERGYATIGCAPCTRPVAPGEDPRAGRWWWERGTHKECGLHRPAARRAAGAAREGGA